MKKCYDDQHALHGVTVAVDTRGPHVYVGRCDNIDPEVVTLLDVDVHRDGQGGRSKQEYLRQAARHGVWKKHDRVVLPRAEVVSVVRLEELAAG